MKDKTFDKITDIIAYALLPITYPLHLWKYRNWGKKRKDETNRTKIKKHH